MGKDKKKNEKKKPKGGKKGREKAKLEKRWGEVQSEADIRASSQNRRGAAIVPRDDVTNKNKRGRFSREGGDSARTRQRESDDEESSSSSSDEEEVFAKRSVGGENALVNLLSRITPPVNSNILSEDSDEGHDDSSSSDESNSNEMEEDDDEDDPSTCVQTDDFSDNYSTVLPSNPTELEEFVSKQHTLQPLQTRHATLHPSLETLLSGSALTRLSRKKNHRTRHPIPKRLSGQWDSFNASPLDQNADAARRSSSSDKNDSSSDCSDLQGTLRSALSTYSDMYFGALTRKNGEAVLNVLVLHVWSHILKSAEVLQKNNGRIKEIESLQEEQQADAKQSKKRQKSAPAPLSQPSPQEEESFRDQGFTRPKILIILPTRGVCLSFCEAFLKLLSKDDDIDADPPKNYRRFQEEYGTTPEETDQRTQRVLEKKGPEWNELFGDDVNTDDDFKIGLSVHPSKKNTHVQFYSQFYKSDIILASPMGLNLQSSSSKEEDEGEEGEDPNKDKHNHQDFFSSIEVCLVYRCNVLSMQNWDHVLSLLSKINRPVRKTHESTDFSRVRNYFLQDDDNSMSKHYRQLIFMSSHTEANILSTFKRFAKSHRGECRILRRTLSTSATIRQISDKQRQVFQRVPCPSFTAQSESRMNYLTSKILPALLAKKQKHTLLFIDSYFDFVSVRNALLRLEKEDPANAPSFVSVTEYSRGSEVSRGRARFFNGQKDWMLYTGRAHYFKRFKIRGVKRVVFVGVPQMGDFYPQVVNMLSDEESVKDKGSGNDEDDDHLRSCLCLFTKYDGHALERIVGMGNCERMVTGDKSTFMFC